MKVKLRRDRSDKTRKASFTLDRKLASYLAASASIGALAASDAKAIVVSNSTVQTVGINGVANIDFNSDGQIDFQIDHDRVDLGGGNIVDYLQLDKNDINGETNPLPFDPITNFQAATFPAGATTPNDANNSAHLVQDKPTSDTTVGYPLALQAGAEIGPSQNFDFQEGNNVFGGGKIARLNRLIDEDHNQVDMVLGGSTQFVTPVNSPQFVGVQNQTRYLGVRMDLNNTSANNTATEFTYGWIGIKVTNEVDATAQVVGYGYETEPGVAIQAGQTGTLAGDYNNNGKVDGADYVLWRNGGPLQNETVTPGATTAEDFNVWRASFGNVGGPISGIGAGSGVAAVPEPSSVVMGLGMGVGLLCAYLCRRIRGR